MGSDALKDILDKKLVSLASEIESEQKRIDDIARLQEVIRVIKENPYILYTSEGEKYVKVLGLEEQNISTLRKIYDGYMLLGREAIPQISIVEDKTKTIQEDLEKKVCLLSDMIAQHQGNIVVYDGYNALSKELSDDSQYITHVSTLRNLLESSELTEFEQNNIMMSIIARNNVIHRVRKTEFEQSIAERNESHYSKAISALRNELENTFGVESLKYLETVSSLLGQFKDVSEVEKTISGWDYSLGISYSDIIDGIITLKNIDILELQDTFGEEDQDVKEEINFINEQISVLNSYKDSIALDRDASIVSVSNLDMNEYERAVYEYNEDPLSYPNHVFFLNNAVGRDIDSIRDKETLQDLFVLLENLKKGNVQPKTLSDANAREIKPFKRGRQARIRYTMLDDNVCVILQIIERKSDKCRGEQQTLKIRQKEVASFANELNNNPSVVEELANVTRVHSDKLLSLVVKSSTSKLGGV